MTLKSIRVRSSEITREVRRAITELRRKRALARMCADLPPHTRAERYQIIDGPSMEHLRDSIPCSYGSIAFTLENLAPDGTNNIVMPLISGAEYKELVRGDDARVLVLNGKLLHLGVRIFYVPDTRTGIFEFSQIDYGSMVTPGAGYVIATVT